MSWLAILGLVVIVVAIAAVFRLKPDEGRPVASTRLMSAARICLVVIGIIIAAVMLQTYL